VRAVRRVRRAAGTGRHLGAIARSMIRNAHADPVIEGQPLVSVVLSTYNWSSVLRHSIHSVLWQTYPHLELLVIGDCCTDDSEQVTASFRDERVRWHNLSSNSGSQAIPNNTGIEMAGGEYIAYQGHDDVWHPKHLATMLAYLQRSGADFGYGMAEVIGPPGSRYRLLSGRDVPSEMPMGRWLPPTSVVHTAELAERSGGWRSWEEAEAPPDVEFINRARKRGARLVRVPAITAFKFPAAQRPGAYRERPSYEQEAYIRRLEREPFFIERELAALTLRRLSPLDTRLPNGDPGEEVWKDPKKLLAWSRRARGLD
jgi:glycosyltransferase involved in cell wall biosynthesis